MSVIYICACKVKESTSPYMVAVYADTYDEAEKLFRLCAKEDGYKIIKESIYCEQLYDLLGCGVQKVEPKPVDIVYESANLNDKL